MSRQNVKEAVVAVVVMLLIAGAMFWRAETAQNRVLREWDRSELSRKEAPTTLAP